MSAGSVKVTSSSLQSLLRPLWPPVPELPSLAPRWSRGAAGRRGPAETADILGVCAAEDAAEIIDCAPVTEAPGSTARAREAAAWGGDAAAAAALEETTAAAAEADCADRSGRGCDSAEGTNMFSTGAARAATTGDRPSRTAPESSETDGDSGESGCSRLPDEATVGADRDVSDWALSGAKLASPSRGALRDAPDGDDSRADIGLTREDAMAQTGFRREAGSIEKEMQHT